MGSQAAGLLLLLLCRVLAAPLRLVARREMCGRRDFRENDSPGAGFYKQPPPAFAISSLIVKGCLRQQPLIKPEPEAHSLLADPGRSGSLSLLTSPRGFSAVCPPNAATLQKTKREKPLNRPSSPAPLVTASPTHGCPRLKHGKNAASCSGVRARTPKSLLGIVSPCSEHSGAGQRDVARVCRQCCSTARGILLAREQLLASGLDPSAPGTSREVWRAQRDEGSAWRSCSHPQELPQAAPAAHFRACSGIVTIKPPR